MTNITIYHNPRCSKSRQALALLQAKSDSLNVVEYLKEGLTKEEVTSFLSIFDGEVSELIRTNEELFKGAPFDTSDPKAVLKGLVKAPKILQRPLIVLADKAIVARPPEKVDQLF